MSLTTPWQDVELPEFPRLETDVQCDVLVVGGGIFGLTAAFLLAREGKRVCLIERGRLGQGYTACTTAHLTQVTDARLSELVSTFGKDGAQLAWEAGAAAIDAIEALSRNEKIDCQFRRIPGFLHASLEEDVDETKALSKDCRLATDLGFEAAFVSSVPQIGRPGVRFANQAKFHPMQYLKGLAKACREKGCAIYEETEATDFSEGPRVVKAGGGKIECNYIIVATHVPVIGETSLLAATLLQTKLVQYTTYAIGARIRRDALPEASFWDTSDPYYYLRIDRGEGEKDDYAIFGGQDHKTGQEDDGDARFGRLESQLRAIVPQADVDHRWSGQVIETPDGLPYIGSSAENQFIGTGFSGNGLTFGTLAGMMACDAALGRKNPWRELFAVDRKKLHGTWDLIKESVDYPYYMVRDRLPSADSRSPTDLQPGEGDILKIDGKRVACSRSDEGELATVSAICTHLGCVVHWNAAERTWDCPCHGSRFQATGEVLSGPAESPLAPIELRAPRSKNGADGSHGKKPQRRRAGTKAHQ